ncbi:uncharacterized protein G2W53_034782 [Senna tora]|uniref:Uncharacterized protein n=1 Tax=Senna tora TaxID=362788 RepID=A0A834T1Y7_9FABA|nr:uncharacterized protein G2W53_034782 [Senna tora]
MPAKVFRPPPGRNTFAGIDARACLGTGTKPRWPKHPCSHVRVPSQTEHPDRATDLDHQIVPAYWCPSCPPYGLHKGLLIWSYDLYGIPDVQPHAYMRGVMIGHDACGIVAKNKKVLAMDFLFVADAFLVVVCKVMCIMIYSHGSLMAAWRESTVKRRTYLVHSREKLASRSPPLRLQHEVQVGLEHALEGLEHALGVLHSQSTTCWTLAGGRSWGTQDPLTAIYIRTRRKRPGGRTVWS